MVFKKRHKTLLSLLLIIIGLPVFLWLSWLLTSPKPLKVFVMDKTAFTSEDAGNKAFTWVKKHHRYIKNDGRDYSPADDYYGFIRNNENGYQIRDLQNLNPPQIQQLAFSHDLAYYIDSYGIYSDLWPDNEQDTLVRKLYGGIGQEDLLMWEYLLAMDKTLIAENIFTPLNDNSIRSKAEEIAGLKWTGWTGRYFQTLNLNMTHNVIPSWMPLLYKNQYNHDWNFTNAGVVFVHEEGQIVVLEQNVDLKIPYPHIRMEKKYPEKYGIGDMLSYPGWFEVVEPISESTQVIAWYELELTAEGRKSLREFNLNGKFPAVSKNTARGRVYYFAGDFSFYPPGKRFICFKGGSILELLLSDLNDPTNKDVFFLSFYLPLMKKLLKDEYQQRVVSISQQH
jgi:hypothetical protein